MADNLWQTKSEDAEREKPSSASGVPPPSPEVKVRTLQSDLDQMAESGGGLPRFESVRAPELGRVREEKPGKEGGGPHLFWMIAAIGAVVAVGAAVFFIYSTFREQGERLRGGTGSGSAAPSQAPLPPAGPRPSVPVFTHTSLFRKPADDTLTFASPSAAESARELKTYGQRLAELFSGVGLGEGFFEVRLQDASGGDLAIDEALDLPDALVLPREFLIARFSPDPTFFIYRDGEGGLWPGYVFALKPAENWLFLRDDVRRLESSSKIENFFLKHPGGRSGGFEDFGVENQTVRSLKFASGAEFFYGWLQGKLIFSASEEGLKAAAERL